MNGNGNAKRTFFSHMMISMASVILTGTAFFMFESKNHIGRDEFTPSIRQMDEERGQVNARLTAIEGRLTDMAVLMREFLTRR